MPDYRKPNPKFNKQAGSGRDFAPRQEFGRGGRDGAGSDRPGSGWSRGPEGAGGSRDGSSRDGGPSRFSRDSFRDSPRGDSFRGDSRNGGFDRGRPGERDDRGSRGFGSAPGSDGSRGPREWNKFGNKNTKGPSVTWGDNGRPERSGGRSNSGFGERSFGGRGSSDRDRPNERGGGSRFGNEGNSGSRFSGEGRGGSRFGSDSRDGSQERPRSGGFGSRPPQFSRDSGGRDSANRDSGGRDFSSRGSASRDFSSRDFGGRDSGGSRFGGDSRPGQGRSGGPRSDWRSDGDKALGNSGWTDRPAGRGDSGRGDSGRGFAGRPTRPGGFAPRSDSRDGSRSGFGGRDGSRSGFGGNDRGRDGQGRDDSRGFRRDEGREGSFGSRFERAGSRGPDSQDKGYRDSRGGGSSNWRGGSQSDSSQARPRPEGRWNSSPPKDRSLDAKPSFDSANDSNAPVRGDESRGADRTDISRGADRTGETGSGDFAQRESEPTQRRSFRDAPVAGDRSYGGGLRDAASQFRTAPKSGRPWDRSRAESDFGSDGNDSDSQAPRERKERAERGPRDSMWKAKKASQDGARGPARSNFSSEPVVDPNDFGLRDLANPVIGTDGLGSYENDRGNRGQVLDAGEFVPPAKSWEVLGWERDDAHDGQNDDDDFNKSSNVSQFPGTSSRSKGSSPQYLADTSLGRGQDEGQSDGPVRKALPDQVVVELSKTVSARRRSRVETNLADATKAYERERYGDCVRVLRDVLEEAPDLPSARELAGLAYYRQGKWREAIRELTRFCELSGSVEQNPVLADCYRAMSNFKKVEELWLELAASSPTAELVAEGRMVAAGALADQGKLDDAIKLLERAPKGPKKVRAHHVRIWFALGDLYERAGENARARALFTQVLAHDPSMGYVRERLDSL